MTAHDPTFADAAIAREIAASISALYDAQARARIVDAWLGGKIDGDDAVALLIDLDLIEVANG